MKRIAGISAFVLAVAALAPVAHAKKMHDMMMPSMAQCHDGYKKEFKDSMHWSKHKFKKACHHMMHAMRHEEKMKLKMMRDPMTKGKS